MVIAQQFNQRRLLRDGRLALLNRHTQGAAGAPQTGHVSRQFALQPLHLGLRTFPVSSVSPEARLTQVLGHFQHQVVGALFGREHLINQGAVFGIGAGPSNQSVFHQRVQHYAFVLQNPRRNLRPVSHRSEQGVGVKTRHVSKPLRLRSERQNVGQSF